MKDPDFRYPSPFERPNLAQSAPPPVSNTDLSKKAENPATRMIAVRSCLALRDFSAAENHLPILHSGR